MRTSSNMPRRMPRTTRRFRLGILVAIVVIIILLTSLRSVARFYTDYLWFEEVNFTSVFRGVLVTKVLLAVMFTAIFFVLMLGNLTIADRVAPKFAAVGPEDELVLRYRQIVTPRGRLVRIVTSAVFALFAGVGANSQWNDWVLFRYHVSFGVRDAENNKDVGFYVFQLPFIKFLLGWFFASVIITLIVTIVSHYLNGGIRFQGQGQRVTPQVKTHISVLLGVLALIQGVDYYFQRLDLVLATNHLVDGATATVVHAERPAKTLLIAIAAIAAVLFLYNIREKGWTLPAIAVALWAMVWVLVGGVYPALYQAIRVSPSEITREKPYIQRNITATQTAYGLGPSEVTVDTNFQGNAIVNADQVSGTSADAVANRQTLANVRLLDPSYVQNAFTKYQELRTYYAFNSLEIDRYPVNVNGQSQLTQTIASVRELNEADVPSGFVNQKLEYTHGYGAVVAPANELGINSDGSPNFSLQNIPPTAGATPTGQPMSGPVLSDQTGNFPQAYYGEGSATGGYVIADSKQPELDYENPTTGAQVASHYDGAGGVKVGNIIRRTAFALRFGDISPLLSGQVTSSSRIMYIRNIGDRVRKAAPFLKYDADPYPVILNGHIYWVQDAYTTTASYPYSQLANTDRVPSGSGLNSSFNYVRNSVKVVIDAYSGSMHFFVLQNNDPIIKVYQRAFPDLFTSVTKADSIIPGITQHWRYPEDLFRVQTNMYGRYHLSDPNQFYTQAQAWTISQDPGSGKPGQTTNIGVPTVSANGQIVTQAQRIQPEYLLTHLPNSTQLEFLSLQPFVPVSPSDKQQNLTAIMTASGDTGTGNDSYGKLEVFETPPNETVDGPALITATINSNPEISEELTLLNQQGSSVELGNVVVVPIDQTLLYVQPVYVESSSNQVPSLRDVIVVYNGTAYHSRNPSIDAALCQITNPGGAQPFAQDCGTAQANFSQTVPNSAGGGNTTSGGSTTTTAPTSPTTALPATGQTVSQLLAAAQAQFTAANAALKNGDLATYAKDVQQAETYVNQAQQLQGQSATGTTTTTSPTTTPPTTATTASSTTGPSG